MDGHVFLLEMVPNRRGAEIPEVLTATHRDAHADLATRRRVPEISGMAQFSVETGLSMFKEAGLLQAPEDQSPIASLNAYITSCCTV